jgi:DNA-binding beta-propeller fold protein YncE
MKTSANLSVIAMIAVCAFGPAAFGATPSNPAPAPVWPLPPDAPRVAYVQSFTQPADAGARQSGFRRLANWLSGATRGNEKFSKPFGVAVDESGDLCLTDTAANTVSFYDQHKKQWNQWTGAGQIRFSSPVSVAKKDKMLFVADSGLGAVIVFDTDGKLLFKIDHDLERPSGLVIHGGRLWVADSQQHCVVAFDLSGKLISKFGKRGVGPGEFNFPTHIAADDTGCLYVTDSMNHRVQIFDADGRFQSQIGGAGDGPGYFSRPKGVAVDTFGHVYVVDALFGNIQIFDRTGQLLLALGGPGSDAGEFYLPNGIAIGRDNRIFVTDGYNRRVQVFKYVGEK